MKITIKSKDNLEMGEFIYKFLKIYILKRFYDILDTSKLSAFDEYLGIKTEDYLDYALRNLTISKLNDDEYIISINKNLKLNSHYIQPIIDFVNYGNRAVQGYPIILNIFKDITENIQIIYKE